MYINNIYVQAHLLKLAEHRLARVRDYHHSTGEKQQLAGSKEYRRNEGQTHVFLTFPADVSVVAVISWDTRTTTVPRTVFTKTQLTQDIFWLISMCSANSCGLYGTENYQ